MKKFILIISVFLTFFGYAQEGNNKVLKNNNKIEELNQRLNNLVGSSNDIAGDSIEYKLDLLFNEIKAIKLEMQSIKASVIDLKSIETSQQDKEREVRLKELDTVDYYVVLASRKDQQRAELIFNQLSKNNKVKLVRNATETWYHVILDEAFSMQKAIEKSSEKRKNGILDSWWVTGKKLTLNSSIQ